MKILSIGLTGSLLLAAVACNIEGGSPGDGVNLESEIDSVSYSLGLNVANNVKAQGLEKINPEALTQAFEDVVRRLWNINF